MANNSNNKRAKMHVPRNGNYEEAYTTGTINGMDATRYTRSGILNGTLYNDTTYIVPEKTLLKYPEIANGAMVTTTNANGQYLIPGGMATATRSQYSYTPNAHPNFKPVTTWYQKLPIVGKWFHKNGGRIEYFK